MPLELEWSWIDDEFLFKDEMDLLLVPCIKFISGNYTELTLLLAGLLPTVSDQIRVSPESVAAENGDAFLVQR